MKTKSLPGIVLVILFFLLNGCFYPRSLPRAKVQKAEYCLNTGDYDQAIDMYRKLIKKNCVSYQVGMAYFQLGESYRLRDDTIIQDYYLRGADLIKSYSGHFENRFEKFIILETLALSYFYLENYLQAATWFQISFKYGTIEADVFEKYVISLRKSGKDAVADSIVNKYMDEHRDVYKGVD